MLQIFHCGIQHDALRLLLPFITDCPPARSPFLSFSLFPALPLSLSSCFCYSLSLCRLSLHIVRNVAGIQMANYLILFMGSLPVFSTFFLPLSLSLSLCLSLRILLRLLCKVLCICCASFAQFIYWLIQFAAKFGTLSCLPARRASLAWFHSLPPSFFQHFSANYFLICTAFGQVLIHLAQPGATVRYQLQINFSSRTSPRPRGIIIALRYVCVALWSLLPSFMPRRRLDEFVSCGFTHKSHTNRKLST